MSDTKSMRATDFIPEYKDVKPPVSVKPKKEEPEYNPEMVKKIKESAAKKGHGPMSGDELMRFLGIDE